MMRNDMFNQNNGDRADVRNVGVFFTDGQSNDRSATFREAVNTRRQVSRYTVPHVGRNCVLD